MFEKTVDAKGCCVKVNGKHEYIFSVSDPELDKIYAKHHGYFTIRISAPIESGTERQNKAAHSLLAAYFASGLHSSSARNVEEFKLWSKWNWGPCYIWDMPDGKQQRIPISWAQYSKQERCDFLDCLVSDCKQSGAYDEDKKVREIIDGMQEEK